MGDWVDSAMPPTSTRPERAPFWKLPIRAATYLALCILLLGGIAVATYFIYVRENWSDAALQETRQSGQVVIDAINSYEAEHGQFPNTLEELIPKYIERLPEVPAGNGAFSYARPDQDSVEFFLSVKSRHFGSLTGTIISIVFDIPSSYSYSVHRDRWIIEDS